MAQPGISQADLQAALIAFRNKQTPHFSDPRLMLAFTTTASTLYIKNKASVLVASDTTAGFTGMAQAGIQDTTDWTANTYKTIYSHTGGGVIYAMVACTAGGAETTTFEITIDGVLREMTVTNANNERAILAAAMSLNGGDFGTDGLSHTQGGLDSATLTTMQTAGAAGLIYELVGARGAMVSGIAGLQYNISALIRMKHSASITNSTATAYSAVLVRKVINA